MTSLRELEQAARNGPWKTRPSGVGVGGWESTVVLPPDARVDPAIAKVFNQHDAALIAATRNALPALLDVVDLARYFVTFVDEHSTLGCSWGCDGPNDPPCLWHQTRDQINASLTALDRSAQ